MKNYSAIFGFPKFLGCVFILQFIPFTFYFYQQRDLTILVISICILSLGIFLLTAKFALSIDKESIKYSFFPFRKRRIPLNAVTHYEIKKVSALHDFLGWGIRYSSKFGWSYIFDSESVLTVYGNSFGKRTFSIKDQKELLQTLQNVGIRGQAV